MATRGTRKTESARRAAVVTPSEAISRREQTKFEEPDRHPQEEALYRALPKKVSRLLKQGLASLKPRRGNDLIDQALKAVDFPEYPALIPLPEELTPEQRAIMEILAYKVGIYAPSFVFPTTARLRRRWLGLEPGGVLEEEIGFEHEGRELKQPLWRAMLLTGRDDPFDAFPFFWNLKLPLAKRLEAFGEFTTGSYFDGYHLEWRNLKAIGDEGRDWAPRFADYLLHLHASDEVHMNRFHDGLKWPLFLSLVRAGIPIEPRWEVFLPVGLGHRREMIECVRAIPEERRTVAIVGALEREPFASTRVRNGLALLKLFPSRELTRVILDCCGAVDDYPKRDILADLAAIAKKKPAVQEALDVFRGKRPKPIVLRCRDVRLPESIEELNEAEQRQLAYAGKLYDGRDLPASARLADNPDWESPSFKGFLEICRLVDPKGKVLYDAFCYQVDSGSIFKAGTTQVVAEIIENGLQCEDEALEEALQVALKEFWQEARRLKAAAKGG